MKGLFMSKQNDHFCLISKCLFEIKTSSSTFLDVNLKIFTRIDTFSSKPKPNRLNETVLFDKKTFQMKNFNQFYCSLLLVCSALEGINQIKIISLQHNGFM